MTPPVPRRCLEALARLKEKARKLFLADGLLTLLTGAAVALALSFLLDYLLALPRGVRLIFLAGGACALFHFFQKKVARPLSLPLTDQELANLVERANPRLRQALITAVELTRPGSESAAHVSPRMLEAVVKDVEERASTIGFDAIFQLQQLRRKAWLLAGLVLFYLGVAGWNTDLLGIWFSRNVLLSAQGWPKQTQLELVNPDPENQPALVAMGDGLEVRVRTLRGSPREVVMYSFSEGTVSRMDTLEAAGPDELLKIVENISRPFSFSVRGGDDEIGRFLVEVRLRPRIDMQSIRLWCTYPPYTGLESTPEEQPLRYGNLKAPTGTTVRFSMASNVEIRKAYLILRGAPGGDGAADGSSWPDAGAVELPVAEAKDFAGQFTVSESGQYYFQLEGLDGFRSVRPDRFRIEAVPDQKPMAKILEPERRTEEVSADASLRVRVSASDDYRVKKCVLEGVYFPPGKDAGVAHTVEFPGFAAVAAEPLSPPASRKPQEDEITLQVSSLGGSGGEVIGSGGRFQFYGLATDFAGQTSDSQVHFLQIVDKVDLMRILTDHLMIVRDQLREVVRQQKSARKDLGELQQKLGFQEKIPAAEASRLRGFRQEQHRVTEALERQTGELNRILTRAARNNVADREWQTWVGSVRDDVEQLGKRKSPDIEQLLEGIQKQAGESPQDSKRLNLVASAQKEVERDVEGIVMRLSEFGDKNALLQMLREVRRRQLELRNATRERGQGVSPEEPQK